MKPYFKIDCDTGKYVHIPFYNCYVHVPHFNKFTANHSIGLLVAAENKDGSIELDDGKPNWVEVTDPDNQEWLDIVNTVYGTSFVMTDFGFPAGYDVHDKSTYHLIPEVHGHHITKLWD